MHINRAPKILILEGQMIIAADVSLQFLKLGYDVIGFVTRAADALKIIESNPPDIVVMNIEMKGKKNGIQMARTILENFQIPVIFLSAHTGQEIFDQVISVRPSAFITKPFKAKDLKRGVETTLNHMAQNANRKKYNQLPSLKNGLFVQH